MSSCNLSKIETINRFLIECFAQQTTFEEKLLVNSYQSITL